MGLNEWDVQCESRHAVTTPSLVTCYYLGIGEAEWAFRTTFDVGQDEISAPNVDLVFDGIDTFASVELVSWHSLDEGVVCLT